MCDKCAISTAKEQINSSFESFGKPSLDKLAQLGKNSEIDQDDMPELRGSTSVKDTKTLSKRAKRKFLAANLAKGLVAYNKATKEIQLDKLKKQTKRKRVITTRKFKNQNHNLQNHFVPITSFDNSKKIKPIPNYTAAPVYKKTKHSTISVLGSAMFLFKKALKQLENESKLGVLLYFWNPRQKTYYYTSTPEIKYAFSGVPINKKAIPSFFKHKKRSKGAKIEAFDVLNNDAQILRSYQNMYHCNREVQLTGEGKVKANYCKNRLCLVCNSIRTAELINKYQPIFDEWEDELYLVTLTVENCTKKMLQPTVDTMFKSFTKVKDILKKMYQKGELEKFEGIRKFECTATRPNDFHPHFHIIVKGRKQAYALRDKWVKVVDKSNVINCKLKGKDKNGIEVYLQDVKKADKNSSKELFKYFTKILSTSSKDRAIYLDRLDSIFKVMRGKRVFQNFGFKLSDYVEAEPAPVDEKINEELLWNLGAENQHQDRINELFMIFRDWSKRDRPAYYNLYLELMELELNYKNLFKGYLSEKQEVKKKEFHAIFENSEKGRIDVENLQLELSILEIQTGFDINLFDDDEGEHIPDLEKPPDIYLFDDNRGNWYSKEDGSPLFKYRLSDSLKEITDSFRLPKGYKTKIFQIYLEEKGIY